MSDHPFCNSAEGFNNNIKIFFHFSVKDVKWLTVWVKLSSRLWRKDKHATKRCWGRNLESTENTHWDLFIFLFILLFCSNLIVDGSDDWTNIICVSNNKNTNLNDQIQFKDDPKTLKKNIRLRCPPDKLHLFRHISSKLSILLINKWAYNIQKAPLHLQKRA